MKHKNVAELVLLAQAHVAKMLERKAGPEPLSTAGVALRDLAADRYLLEAIFQVTHAEEKNPLLLAWLIECQGAVRELWFDRPAESGDWWWPNTRFPLDCAFAIGIHTFRQSALKYSLDAPYREYMTSIERLIEDAR